MDADLEAIISTTNTERARFEAFCRSLSNDELEAVVPNSHWRTKEYISHLATIDIWVGGWFADWASGRRFTFLNADGTSFDIDRWNEDEVSRLHGATVEEILGEAARHREPLLATMATFTRPVLDQEFDFRGNRITFLRYLQLWTGHDAAHSWDMVRALPARQGDPELAAWFRAFRLPPA
ncbi:MAG: DinB family protein [Dehalococcoidia bacterium]